MNTEYQNIQELFGSLTKRAAKKELSQLVSGPEAERILSEIGPGRKHRAAVSGAILALYGIGAPRRYAILRLDTPMYVDCNGVMHRMEVPA